MDTWKPFAHTFIVLHLNIVTNARLYANTHRPAHTMKIESSDFRPRERKAINLAQWPTIVPPLVEAKRDYEELLKQHIEDLSPRAASSLGLRAPRDV